MGYLNKNTKSLADNMGFLTDAVRGWLAYMSVRQIVSMSDEMQNLSNRLKLTLAPGEQLADVLGKIADLADRTRQSVGDVAETYNRFAVSLKRVHANSDELVSLTEVLIDTFKLSGSNASETKNAMVQLSQAFSVGVLRGQDLRSVLEQNSVVAGLLREKYGTDLFKKAEQGMIRVSDVVQILSSHQKEILAQAEKLAPTFEQTLTKAANRFTLAIGEMNENMGLSAKFANVMEFAMSNLASVLTIAGGAMALVAIAYIPEMIAGIQKLRAAMIALSVSNPILLLLTGITVAGALIYENFDKLTILFKKFEVAMTNIGIAIDEKLIPALTTMSKFVFGKSFSDNFTEGLKGNLDKAKQHVIDLKTEIANLEKAQSDKNKPKTTDQGAALQNLLSKLKSGDAPGKLQKIKEILGEINNEFLTGAIDVDEYNRKLVNFEIYKLNREFKEGKFDIFTYNARLKELNIQEFNRQMKNGYLSLQQFQDAVRKANIKELTDKFQAGKISLYDYNAELIKLSDKFQPGAALYVGTQNYINSIGTLSENIAKSIAGVFSNLEDTLLEFTKTGEFNFAKFTGAILDDLERIIIRMSIIKPLANAILGIYSPGGKTDAGSTDLNGGSYAGDVRQAANGMAFEYGTRKFANGGIVNRPTPFSYGGGRRGLMGEAGTEAIMPLRRGSDGRLGVAASGGGGTVVNIFNQSNSDVSQTERTGPNGEKTIDILIHSKVKEGLSTGKYDSAMKGAYGVNRRGS